MSRTSLSSWRTLVWGRGTLLLFAAIGLIPLLVATFAPSRFQWGEGPAPWYAPLVITGVLAAGLWFVHRVVGSLQPVSVDANHIFVSRWIGEEAYPKRTLQAAFVDRDTSVVGQNPIVLRLQKDGRLTQVSFLMSERLDQDDVGEALGTVVIDAWDAKTEIV